MEKLKVNNMDLFFNETELEEIQDNQDLIQAWCKARLLPHLKQSINFNHSSYGLKHLAEKELGFYISNGQLKYAMAMLGVNYSQRPNSPNCFYPLSEKFFTHYKRKFRIHKNTINKITPKDDVDIIYTPEKCLVCEKNSIIDLGDIVLFDYAGRKE